MSYPLLYPLVLFMEFFALFDVLYGTFIIIKTHNTLQVIAKTWIYYFLSLHCDLREWKSLTPSETIFKNPVWNFIQLL